MRGGYDDDDCRRPALLSSSHSSHHSSHHHSPPPPAPRYATARSTGNANAFELISALRKRLVGLADAAPMPPPPPSPPRKSSLGGMVAPGAQDPEVSVGLAPPPSPASSKAAGYFGDGLGGLAQEDAEALDRLTAVAKAATSSPEKLAAAFEFDRKFLFKVLVLGNGQLAQLCGARGPNIQTNAACAGTTQAIGIAQDMILRGRCDRVIVVAGDSASSSTLLPWLGNGFRALGAASIASSPATASCPFDARRNGMVLGAGACGLVLESRAAFARRSAQAAALLAPPRDPDPGSPSGGDATDAGSAAAGPSSNGSGETVGAALAVRPNAKAMLVDAQFSNSAYHGAALGVRHITSELDRFLTNVHSKFGITRASIARRGVYLSHETGTHSSPTASCAYAEVTALRHAFGDDLRHLHILSTKGFTGHAMGVSFEDVCAVEVLHKQRMPAVSNYKSPDPLLNGLRISVGGPVDAVYALRFAAGFGSHVSFTLYEILR